VGVSMLTNPEEQNRFSGFSFGKKQSKNTSKSDNVV